MPRAIIGIHTTTSPSRLGWVNEANGVVLSQHRDKAPAVERGRKLAKRYRTKHTIHRKDGSVIATQSFAPVPMPE